MNQQSADDNSDDIDSLKQEVSELKQLIEDQKWGMQKTNEGIKTLYKELEIKNKELEKLDQLKSDFVSTVSHELRTPLTIIKESITQVNDEVLGEVTQGQKKTLAMALDNIDRLSRIIDNILDISKLEEKQYELNKKYFDVVALVKEVIVAFGPIAKNKGLEFRSEFSDEILEIIADRDKIVQIFTNLIGNALKFTVKGYIKISVIDRDEMIECCVLDTGKGVPEEKVSKVFDKFQQFERQEGPGSRGTGLGLSICKHIVELHGGRIGINSQLGKGTSFIFTLPKAMQKKS